MTAKTPAHGQRRRLDGRIHSCHVAVARLARDTGKHVTLVREPNVIRQVVYAKPWYWFLVFPVLEQLHDFGSFLRDCQVALGAALN
jgi:hypothetical protein